MNKIISIELNHEHYLDDVFSYFMWDMDDRVKRSLMQNQFKICQDGPKDLSLIYYGDHSSLLALSNLEEKLDDRTIEIEINGSEEYFKFATDLPYEKKSVVVLDNTSMDTQASVNNSSIELGVLSQSMDVQGKVCVFKIFLPKLIEDIKSGVLTYQAKLKAREIPRFYYIENTGRIVNQCLSIESSNGYQFISEDDVIVVNGLEYRVFHSGEKPLPIRSSKNEILSLILTEIDGSYRNKKVLINALPDPQPDNLVAKKQGKTIQSYCDMYLTLI